MNEAVNTMTGYIQAQNQFQTLNMIGKDVLAESDVVSLTDGRPDMNISVVTTEPCKLVAYIVDKDGNQQRKIDLGFVEPGEHDLKWNGLGNGEAIMKDGPYALQVTATSPSGELLSDGVYPQLSGKITGVSFDASGQPVIHMGSATSATLALGQVIQILENGAIKTPQDSSEPIMDEGDSDAA